MLRRYKYYWTSGIGLFDPCQTLIRYKRKMLGLLDTIPDLSKE